MALTSSWGIFCAKEQVVVCIATSNTGRKRDHVQEAEVRKLGTSKREDLRGRNLLSLHYTWCHEQRRRRLWREMCCRRKDFKRDFHKVDKLCFSALGTYWYIGWFIFTEDKKDPRYWNLEQKNRRTPMGWEASVVAKDARWYFNSKPYLRTDSGSQPETSMHTICFHRCWWTCWILPSSCLLAYYCCRWQRTGNLNVESEDREGEKWKQGIS